MISVFQYRYMYQQIDFLFFFSLKKIKSTFLIVYFLFVLGVKSNFDCHIQYKCAVNLISRRMKSSVHIQYKFWDDFRWWIIMNNTLLFTSTISFGLTAIYLIWKIDSQLNSIYHEKKTYSCFFSAIVNDGSTTQIV